MEVPGKNVYQKGFEKKRLFSLKTSEWEPPCPGGIERKVLIKEFWWTQRKEKKLFSNMVTKYSPDPKESATTLPQSGNGAWSEIHGS
jgi:hypothetical protein